MVTKTQSALFHALVGGLRDGHADHHERAVMAMLESAPAEKRASLQDLIAAAKEKAAKLGIKLDWTKLLAAFTVALSGGWSAEAIQAAVALLLGAQIPIPHPLTPPAPVPPVPAPASTVAEVSEKIRNALMSPEDGPGAGDIG